MAYFMGCMFFSNFSCQPYVINIQLCNTDNICTDLYILLKPQSKLGYLGLYSVCHTLSRGFLKLALTGPRRLESQKNVIYTFYLRQVKFFSQFKTIFYRQNMNVYLTY